tara:strand:+ start:735 stop:962 length:228 start_codon:yes stop_codon:yes gene_type:complete
MATSVNHRFQFLFFDFFSITKKFFYQLQNRPHYPEYIHPVFNPIDSRSFASPLQSVIPAASTSFKSGWFIRAQAG